MNDDFRQRPLTPDDQQWLPQFMIDHWGDEMMVAHGEAFYPAQLPGFVALLGNAVVGLVTYRLRDDACEITSLDSLRERRGIGSALVTAVIEVAQKTGCHRVWLITTNDNLNALRFYQKRGFVLTAVYPNAVTQSRRLKPSIPLFGFDGLPLRDEIELEIKL